MLLLKSQGLAGLAGKTDGIVLYGEVGEAGSVVAISVLEGCGVVRRGRVVVGDGGGLRAVGYEERLRERGFDFRGETPQGDGLV